jgi:hypothetical protein
MSNVIPFDPQARRAVAAPQADHRLRASIAAGLQLGWKPDFMVSKHEAQPFIDALGEAAREVADDQLRFTLKVLATALIARSTVTGPKPKKRRRA